MDTLKSIISEKEILFVYMGHNGSIAYLNHQFKDLNKKIQYALEVSPQNVGKTRAGGCTTISLSEITKFEKEKIAIFCTRYYATQDTERQLRRYGLIQNIHYFYVEDFTIYPIREDIHRSAMHAPWSMDHDFIDIFNKVRNHTLVDIYRCFELKSLLEQVAHLEGCVLEVGVYHGGSGFLLASYAQKFNKRVFLADTFCGFVNADHEFDRGLINNKEQDYSDISRNLLATSQLQNYEFLIGSFPEDTAKRIENEKFCFCHIDTDVYWAVKNPTEWVWDRLVVGGVIVYDDYGFNLWDGATRFVDEISRLQDRMYIYNINGHGIIIKTS